MMKFLARNVLPIVSNMALSYIFRTTTEYVVTIERQKRQHIVDALRRVEPETQARQHHIEAEALVHLSNHYGSYAAHSQRVQAEAVRVLLNDLRAYRAAVPTLSAETAAHLRDLEHQLLLLHGSIERTS